MAEQLTQAQIDSLLGRMESDDQETTSEEERNVRKYDFKSPKKFTKEQLRALDGLHENFARLLGSYLTGSLRTYCEVNVHSTEEQRFFEYSNALPDSSLIGMLSFKPEARRYTEGIILMDMSTSLGYYFIDRLLGGSGEKYNLNRDYTDIELTILQDTFQGILGRLTEAWDNYLKVSISLSGIETNARLLQTLAPEDIVVIVTLDVEAKNLNGTLTICLPAEILEGLMGTFSVKYNRSTKRQSAVDTEARRNLIFDELLDTDLEIKAVLDQSQLTLRDVLQLQVSDVIPLQSTISSDICVMVDDIPWYSAKLGETKTKKAVKLNQALN